MESPPNGTPNAVGGSSEPGARSEDSTDDFIREVAHAEELPPPASAPRVGHTFGRFRVVAELGRGGMGIVYLAHDESLQRSVALKLLNPSLSRHDERQRRFLREARAAAAVTHPNLTTIYDVGEIDGRTFIAMERLDGASLRQLLAAGPLPIHEAVRIALSLLAGLEQAHRAGFVHRDLKPDNVIVTNSGVVKLLDFGLAKRHDRASASEQGRLGDDSSQRHTAAGQLLGTPAYMSPEQVRSAAVDCRSDIFSFGVLLYEMLAGRRPFAAPSTAELHSAILRDAPRPLGEQRADVPRALAAVLEQCLHKDPAQRYPSCSAVAQELARALEPSDGSARPPPTDSLAPDLARSGPRPARVRVRTGLVIAASLSIGLAGSVLLLQRAEHRPGSAEASSSANAADALSAAGSLDAAPATSAATSAGPPAAPTLGSVPVPVTALALPASNSEEALAAYSAALQATRDGNWGHVTQLLERATTLDPTLAIAHLRLAICYSAYPFPPRTGRAWFERALLGRASLNERDQMLLDAFEPMYRDPPDRDELLARLRAATARYPNDAELQTLLAAASPGPSARLAAARRAVELDPQNADGWQLVGSSLLQLGNSEEGLRALERCVAISPAAVDCRGERGFFHGREGRCLEMDEDFRAALASGRSLIWHDGRATALFALGRPLEASLEIYRRKWSLLPPDLRTVTELADRSELALAVGDFAEAERLSLEARRHVAAEPDTSQHARFALQLVDIYTETGRLQDAGRIADDYLRRKAGWVSSLRFESLRFEDVTMQMNWAMLRAKLLTRESFVERREAWLRELEPHMRGSLRAEMLAQYATGVETEAEARETLLLFPELKTPPAQNKLWWQTLVTPRLDVLAGRAGDAIPPLEKVARSCGALSEPVEYVRASWFLGRAHEATGNGAGACAAYGNVLARWGNATPPSRTARQARARSLALRCKESAKTKRTL